MPLQDSKFLMLLLLLLLSPLSLSSSSSRWLKKVGNQRQPGCRNRPWICSRGEIPPRSLCCRNRCVNVSSDTNNCGLCGVRCLFNSRCCGGLCMNTNANPLNCGRCGQICPPGRLCLFGLCGYAQPLPPWPFPLPPPFPFPPTLPKQKPPRLPHCCHPRPQPPPVE